MVKDWSEEYVWVDGEDELDIMCQEDEVDGVGAGGVLVSMKVQLVNIEQMVSLSQALIMVVVATWWVTAKSLKDMLCWKIVW